jgi:hypothetical protein
LIFNLASLVIILLFAGGGFTYIVALYEEHKTKAEFYLTLTTLGALLTITATFAAIIATWLGVIPS